MVAIPFDGFWWLMWCTIALLFATMRCLGVKREKESGDEKKEDKKTIVRRSTRLKSLCNIHILSVFELQIPGVHIVLHG